MARRPRASRPTRTPSRPPASDRLKIIAFDLDGTLVDSVVDIAAGLNAGLADVGAPALSVDTVRTFVGNGARILVARALAAVGRPTTEADVDALYERYGEHYDRALVAHTRVFAGVADVLAELKGQARLAVATNKPGRPSRAIVAALMPDTFDLVLGPDDVGEHKPSAAVLARIARELHGRVAAFVGDSAVDVETAARAGVPSVAVTWGLKPDELQGATHRVDTADALRRVLVELV